MDSHYRSLTLLLVFTWLLLTGTGNVGRLAFANPPMSNRLHRPIAAAILNGSQVALANQGSGSISLIDLELEEVIADHEVGRSLVDIQSLGEDRVVVIDHGNHELTVCRFNDEQIMIDQRVSVPKFPITLEVSDSLRWCVVTSLWSRAVSLVALDAEAQTHPATTLTLPFAPRCVALIEDKKRLVVTDAFGGKLAVVGYSGDLSTSGPGELQLLSLRTIPGHNIRHLAVRGSGDLRRLHLSQMTINQLAEPSEDEVHWGAYIFSGIRSFSFDSLLNPAADLLADSELLVLGDVARGLADPAEFHFDADGNTAVLCTGSNEVAFFNQFGAFQNRVSVGAGAVSIEKAGPAQFVTVNRFDQTVSLVSLEDDGVMESPSVRTVSLVDRVDPTVVQRGEELFYSANLSHDGWMSCHSCHTDGHSCGLTADTLGDDFRGAPKRILSLHGVADTQPLSWNGTNSFGTQVRESILKTMHGDDPAEDQVEALVAFMKSLAPLPTFSELKDVDEETLRSVSRGKALFASKKCIQCHAGAEFTSAKTYDVGLSDQLGHSLFNPPSLRGVLHRERFFHDNRAGTLRDVFDLHQHPSNLSLTASELGDLISYLLTL